MEKPRIHRTISSTDVTTSTIIRDSIERDVTLPADKANHRFLLTLPKYTVVLPDMSSFDQDFKDFLLPSLIDIDIMKEMEYSRCLNWCPKLSRFLALNTMGDGNCLMNAASLCMWAVQDRRLTLRKTVYQALIEDQTDMYRKRWQYEVERYLEEQNNGSLMDIGIEQWNTDWKKTVALASTTKSTETHCLSPLEEIHIFALANILRRPIFVLCDNIHRGNHDEPLADVNLGGVYLPLFTDSVNCIKTPLLIGYHHGHFTALVTSKDKHLSGEEMVNGVPLTKHDGQPMKVHFLLPEEERSSDHLLREYLNCAKIEYVDEYGDDKEVLIAKMELGETEVHLHRMLKQYFEVIEENHLEALALKQLWFRNEGENPPGTYASNGKDRSTCKQDDFTCCNAHKRCRNRDCKNHASLKNDYCYQCQNTGSSQLCTSPGCSYMGNPDCEGLCTVCFRRYHAILQQGSTMVVPSAPPSEKCIHVNCTNKANVKLHGMCYNCYLANYVHGFQFENGVSTSRVSTQNDQRNMDDRRHSQVLSSSQNCDIPLQNPEHIYGRDGNLFPRNTEGEICTYSGCVKQAVTTHNKLCYEHYIQSSKQQKAEATRMKCINEGCAFFGSPQYNYMCSQCYARALQMEHNLETERKIKAQRERERTEHILAQRENSSRTHRFNQQRKPYYYEAISTSQTASKPTSQNQRRTNATPCITRGCPHLTMKEDLCEICFKKKEKLLY